MNSGAIQYRRGYDFEVRTRKKLETMGFEAIRSPGSKTPADIRAFCREGKVYVQCKRSGSMRPAEWNAFLDYCEDAGALPVLAKPGRNGRGVEFYRIVGRKDGKGGKQPFEPWEGDMP